MNIRKTAALLLCLALVLSMLAGCGAANTNNAAVPENNSNVENSAGSENTVPVPEDAIQLVKSDAQVLKEADIFEFDFENDTAFVETVRKFMGLIRKGIKIQKEIRKYKAIKAALNGEDGGESEE